MFILIDYLTVYLLIICLSALTFTVYDKHAAKTGTYRISEKTLFLVELLGGSLAMFITMKLVHHKTRT